MNELRRHRFGKKSERFIDPEHPQLSLLEDNAAIFAEAEAKGDAINDEIQIASHTRNKKKKLKNELPRRIKIIPVSEADKTCACGLCKTVIRYETKESIHYQPPIHEILVQKREVVACAKGCDGQMITAPAPLHVLPKARATEEFLAFLIISKLQIVNHYTI